MKILVIIKISTLFAILLSVFMLTCTGVAIYYQEYTALRTFTYIPLSIIGVSIFLHVLSSYLMEKYNATAKLKTKDGIILTIFAWIMFCGIGALPYLDYVTNVTDAIFESVSGFTTTGASVFSDLEVLPKTLIFWRSMTEWLGGMGFVVLTVAFLPLLGSGGMQLMQAEAPGPSVDKLAPTIQESAKLLWYLYIAYTLIMMFLLTIGGVSEFNAINIAFTTVATGGFMPVNDPSGFFADDYTSIIIVIFMIVGAINFSLQFRFLQGYPKDIIKDNEFQVYITIVISLFIISIFNGLDRYIPEDGKYALIESIKMSFTSYISVFTTTGFSVEDYSQWGGFYQMIMFVLFFIGACSGSTSGGNKVIRWIILSKQMLIEMKYLIYPAGVFTLTLNKQPVQRSIAYSTFGFIVIYFMSLFLLTVIMALVDSSIGRSTSIMTAFSAVFSALGNYAPGFDAVGYAGNYTMFNYPAKVVLCIAMLLGRLEFFTVLIVLVPAFWRR